MTIIVERRVVRAVAVAVAVMLTCAVTFTCRLTFTFGASSRRESVGLQERWVTVFVLPSIKPWSCHGYRVCSSMAVGSDERPVHHEWDCSRGECLMDIGLR